mmetsp:Transcript_85385/g.227671  ORF Transcript_85385/g.227671 Transcript_85385/m.227671 type:complete len:154 (+) Transcript_85385:1-462(+)
MTSVFSSVPRPNAANNVSSQVSSFLDTVKASGTSAINLVKDNSQLQAGAAAIKNKASQLSDNVSNVLKSTPIAAVSQQASEKAQQVQGLITGQTKEPETVAEYVEEAMTMSYKNRKTLSLLLSDINLNLMTSSGLLGLVFAWLQGYFLRHCQC